ncbi:hypothetical protein P7K49_005889 [Saguinus oedipus]|uniref:Uncharacterized protein n=1 Tax=Saguinus oedipus TaxID=9490 RepID=A0ABQ9W0U8_SAGOE|nr:hypothetical protein P7K49_005889 [Saguinus oedipus]
MALLAWPRSVSGLDTICPGSHQPSISGKDLAMGLGWRGPGYVIDEKRKRLSAVSRKVITLSGHADSLLSEGSVLAPGLLGQDVISYTGGTSALGVGTARQLQEAERETEAQAWLLRSESAPSRSPSWQLRGVPSLGTPLHAQSHSQEVTGSHNLL